nr:MAG TPA: hypothetical protein [Caudoviricetes sp.]
MTVGWPRRKGLSPRRDQEFQPRIQGPGKGNRPNESRERRQTGRDDPRDRRRRWRSRYRRRRGEGSQRRRRPGAVNGSHRSGLQVGRRPDEGLRRHGGINRRSDQE